jgi:glycosyltransferase involved in cell wall biosynthesis
LGQGAALQTGIDFALAQQAEYLVTFDADGQHRAKDAYAMVNQLIRSEVDVLLGSRFIGEAKGIPASRRILLKWAGLFTRATTRLNVTDTHNGLRVLTRRAAEMIKLRHNRMAHASELLGQIADQGLRYAEHPVTIVYTPYSLAKGQQASGAAAILLDLLLGRTSR